MEFNIDKVENIVGKVENTGYLHFLLFLNAFKRCLPLGGSYSEPLGKKGH